MSNTTISANMNLPVPVVGVDPGPDWATDINSCFTLIDQHNHTPGSGVQITPAGININSDFALNGNNLTLARSSRYSVQASPLALSTDLNCAYVSGVDLYYNDGNGNQIQITQSGGIAGTPGSISNLTSPASASYVSASSTFVWQSDVNTAANMDGGSVLLRNITASSKALTLSPPNAMAANYTLTLPPTAGANGNFITMTTSGNMSSSVAVDNSTLEVDSNSLRVKFAGIGTAQIANSAITTALIADHNVTLVKAVERTLDASNTVTGPGNFISFTTLPTSFTTTSFVDWDQSEFTISNVIANRFIHIYVQPTFVGLDAIKLQRTSSTITISGEIKLLMDGATTIWIFPFSYSNNVSSSMSIVLPFPSHLVIPNPFSGLSGSHTFKFQGRVVASGPTFTLGLQRIIVYQDP